MKNLHIKNAESRRDFITKTASMLLGVSALSFDEKLLASGANKFLGKAKHIIYIYMNGGMSHLDTFDPKDSDNNGGVKPINTIVPNLTVSKYFPNLAKFAPDFSLVRGMSSRTGAHAQGQYLMRTSYPKNSLIVHPGMGAITSNLLGKQHGTIPDNVLISGDSNHPKEGYLNKRFSPLPILNPNEGLRFSKKSVEDSIFNKRLAALNFLNSNFDKTFSSSDIKSNTDLYDETVKLLSSKDLDIFDLKKESQNIRDSYGNSSFGQGLLLARRLVENGVRFVEVDLGGWDMHVNIATAMEERSSFVDKALAFLFEDLKSRGLLNETLVVVATEFGRTVEGENQGLNKNLGRDHHPGAFSCLVGGCEIGGKVVGATDNKGSKVIESPTSIGQLNSTIGYLIGIKPDFVWHSPNGRPFTTGNGEKVIDKLVL